MYEIDCAAIAPSRIWNASGMSGRYEIFAHRNVSIGRTRS